MPRGFVSHALVAVLVFPCCVALAQATRGAYRDVRDMPTGAAGEAIRAVLDAVNSNEPTKVRALVVERFTEEFRGAHPMEEHLAVFGEVYERHRGFEFHGVRRYEDEAENRANEYVVIVQSKLTGTWRAILLQLEPPSAGRIAGLRFMPARPPSDLPAPAKLSDDAIVEEVRKFLDRLVEVDAFSGSVLLAKDGNVLFTGAYGSACRATAFLWNGALPHPSTRPASPLLQ